MNIFKPKTIVKVVHHNSECPEWTQDDTTALARFFKSVTGIRFLAKTRALVNVMALNGCAEQFNTSHAAGQAHGAHELIKAQESWAKLNFAATGESEENNTTSGESEAAVDVEKRAF